MLTHLLKIRKNNKKQSKQACPPFHYPLPLPPRCKHPSRHCNILDNFSCNLSRNFDVKQVAPKIDVKYRDSNLSHFCCCSCKHLRNWNLILLFTTILSTFSAIHSKTPPRNAFLDQLIKNIILSSVLLRDSFASCWQSHYTVSVTLLFMQLQCCRVSSWFRTGEGV